MGTMDERELFNRRYEGVGPDKLWRAVKRALATMDSKEANEAGRTVQFSTGVSLTSWCQNMLASVTGAPEASTLTVFGRPKGSLLTSTWGEDVHARGIEKQVVSAVEAQLPTRSAG